MPDHLTSEEKAAIAAFPKERVYQCRRGESGIPLRGFPIRVCMQHAVSRARRVAAFARNREIDDVIRNLWQRGLTDEEISQKVKLKPNTVYKRRFRMGLTKGK
jgi:predicted RNA binding protein with dsRBD fold (UPF0201 family)